MAFLVHQPELFAGLLKAAKSCHASVSGGATEILCNLLGDTLWHDCDVSQTAVLRVDRSRDLAPVLLPTSLLPEVQLVMLRTQEGAGRGVSSNTPELDLRALQEVCAAATSALAECVQQGEVEEHMAEAVVRLACAAAEREPEACTSSSEQVQRRARFSCLREARLARS